MIPHKYRAVEFGKKVVQHMKTKNQTLADVLSFVPKYTGIRYFENESRRNWFVLLPPTETTWAFVNLRLYQEFNSNKIFFGISFFNHDDIPDRERSLRIINTIQSFINNSGFASSFESEVRFKPDMNWSKPVKEAESNKYAHFRFWKYKKWEFDTEDLSNNEESVESLCNIIIDFADFFKHLVLEVKSVSDTLTKRISKSEQGKLFLETDWNESKQENEIISLKKTGNHNPIQETEKLNPLDSSFLLDIPKLEKESNELIPTGLESKEDTSEYFTNNGVEFKIEEYRKKINIGLRGELCVLKFEKERLSQINIDKEPLHVSLENDGAGYDIQSWDENGNEIYIEVKSTISMGKSGNFFLSFNEYSKSTNMENYYLYFVREVDTVRPKVNIIKNPFKPENSEIFKRKIHSYKVAYKFK